MELFSSPSGVVGDKLKKLMAMMMCQMMGMVMSRSNACRRWEEVKYSTRCYGSFLYSEAGKWKTCL